MISARRASVCSKAQLSRDAFCCISSADVATPPALAALPGAKSKDLRLKSCADLRRDEARPWAGARRGPRSGGGGSSATPREWQLAGSRRDGNDIIVPSASPSGPRHLEGFADSRQLSTCRRPMTIPILTPSSTIERMQVNCQKIFANLPGYVVSPRGGDRLERSHGKSDSSSGPRFDCLQGSSGGPISRPVTLEVAEASAIRGLRQIGFCHGRLVRARGSCGWSRRGLPVLDRAFPAAARQPQEADPTLRIQDLDGEAYLERSTFLSGTYTAVRLPSVICKTFASAYHPASV